MKKFVTLLSAALIAVASLATVASAAPITEDTFKPKGAIDVYRVKDGEATLRFTLELEKDLDFVNEGDELDAMCSGFGLTSYQISVASYNADIFDTTDLPSTAYAIAGGYNGDFALVKVSKNKSVTLGSAKLPLKGEYANMTAEELNALNFATFDKVIFEITQWDEADSTDDMVTDNLLK